MRYADVRSRHRVRSCNNRTVRRIKFVSNKDSWNGLPRLIHVSMHGYHQPKTDLLLCTKPNPSCLRRMCHNPSATFPLQGSQASNGFALQREAFYKKVKWSPSYCTTWGSTVLKRRTLQLRQEILQRKKCSDKMLAKKLKTTTHEHTYR